MLCVKGFAPKAPAVLFFPLLAVSFFFDKPQIERGGGEDTIQASHPYQKYGG
jgi:hypothetical protein